MAQAATRRWLAVTLIAAGAVLLWSAPQTWHGALLMVLGVLLELFGIALGIRRGTQRRKSDDQS